MSMIPESLREAKRYLVEKTGRPGANFSIRAARSARGFHAGKAEIFGPDGKGNRDYSVRDPRNKAGLTNASSALDIKIPKGQLKALTAHLVANPGDLLFEVIGPDSTGAANYWSVKTGWQPRPNLAPPSHSWHAHVGFWRDTEFADRTAPFRSFYEPNPPAPEPEPDPDTEPDAGPTLSDVEALEAENAELRTKIENAKAALA